MKKMTAKEQEIRESIIDNPVQYWKLRRKFKGRTNSRRIIGMLMDGILDEEYHLRFVKSESSEDGKRLVIVRILGVRK